MVPTSPAVSSDPLYCYVNTTNQVQSIRLLVGFEPRLEKLVFPGEKLLIEPVDNAELEILKCESGAISIERITCFS